MIFFDQRKYEVFAEDIQQKRVRKKCFALLFPHGLLTVPGR
jgi:hypothetical protein